MAENLDDERRRFAEAYALMNDGELENIAGELGSLTQGARLALEQELSKRGLERDIESTDDPADDSLNFAELVVIQTFRDLPQALLAKGKLEAAGIESFLIDEHMVRMDWFISNLLGGVKLGVREEDAEEAAGLIDEAIPDAIEIEGEDSFDQPRCPECGSHDISFENINKKVGVVSAWIAFPIPVRRNKWKCAACGNEWRNDDQGAP